MGQVSNNLVTERLSAGAVFTSAEPTGTIVGEPVKTVVKDAISTLEDASEELTFGNSKNVEALEFGKRVITAQKPVQLIPVKKIQEYLDFTRNFDARRLEDIITRLLVAPRPGELVRAESDKPAVQYALLQLALTAARERNLSAERIELLRDALATLERESGPEIWASLNTIEAAAQFDPSAKGVENFQRAYVEIALQGDTFAQKLMVVLQRLAGAKGEDFARGLQALLNALAADLSASPSSLDANHLHAVIEDVYQLEVAGSVLEGCDKLAGRMADRFDISSIEPIELMKSLVMMTSERWVFPQKFSEMAAGFGVLMLQPRIAFHTGAKNLLRKMPGKVFTDADAQAAMLVSAQTVLDEAIAEEEDQEGGAP